MLMIPLVVLLLFPAPVFADYAKQAVGYECKKIDPAKYGFNCSIKEGRMHLHWREDTKKMPKDRRESAGYVSKKLTLGYYDAGGDRVVITADHWPADKAKMCSPAPSRRDSICFNCQGKDEYGAYKCDE